MLPERDVAEDMRDLCCKGLDLDACDAHGNTVLHVLAHRGFHNCVAEIVWAQGAGPAPGLAFHLRRVNQRGLTPLMVAVQGGWVRVAEVLVTAGASGWRNTRNGGGLVALAATAGQVPMLHWLFECTAWAKPGTAWRRVQTTETTRIAMLEGVDSAGCTPLHQAFAHARFDAARALLELGACPHARDARGKSVLTYAVETNAPADLLVALVAAGVDVHAADADGCTAVTTAARQFVSVHVHGALRVFCEVAVSKLGSVGAWCRANGLVRAAEYVETALRESQRWNQLKCAWMGACVALPERKS